MVRLAINLQKIADFSSLAIPTSFAGSAALGIFVSPWFHIATVPLGLVTATHWYFKYAQKEHTILRIFGFLGAARYMLESIGPELRQYFYMSDTEERPFNRSERSEVYRKAKDVDSAESFGSLMNFDNKEIKLRHSMYPVLKRQLKPFKVTFGEERKLKTAYTINKPFIISAMSFGALGSHAVRALNRGAKIAGIPQNTGEGGYPKYHFMEGGDIIFQMGTAKFGVRNDDSTLNDKKLKDIASKPTVKMIEIKFSQGAKPGKGGLLPKEKVTQEIADLRHIPMGKDVKSPGRHVECDTPSNTVKFIKRVQDVSQLPVGIKMCMGREDEFRTLIKEMKRQRVFPDYIAIDGAEGGTGASPKSFMDGVGLPIYVGLEAANRILTAERVRKKLKLIASGKLLNTRRQLVAFAHGADAIYIARGFMFALGCIQALQCGKDTCPTGITTHDPKLQRGLVIEDKAHRVANYVKNMEYEFKELLSAMGVTSVNELKPEMLYEPEMKNPMHRCTA